MNYRHGYHAGNFADVVKHLALVRVLLHLRRKETPFAVIDSHAGRGLYALDDAPARATGEAEAGIARLTDLAGPEPLATYLALVRDVGGNRYPGSPLLAAKLLRPQDRLIAIEKHPEEAAALKAVLAPFRNALVEQADGYQRLAKLLPPPARRGVILVDPPFEEADEFARLARALAGAIRRFATGIYLVWYPVKARAAAEAFCGEVLAAGPHRLLRVEIAVPAPEGKLSRAGLLVVNPPYGFEPDMQAALALAAPRLDGEASLDWLAGPDA
jgi:23S rRNA (adenine2030-N6)-methyltransferase